MSIPTSFLPFFRTENESRMTDACVVKRKTGETFNDTTGEYTPTYTTIYTGACWVRPLAASEATFGQEQVGLRGYPVYIPYTVTTVQKGDLVDITSATDSFLTGKQFVVTNVSGDTYVTKRKLDCEDVV
jgi:hypothetical protein